MNVRHLADEYDVSKSDTLANSVELTVTGLLLASVLLGTQIFLAGRFRRIVNPALLGSMALLVVMGLWLLYALSATQGWLKLRKKIRSIPSCAVARARDGARRECGSIVVADGQRQHRPRHALQAARKQCSLT